VDCLLAVQWHTDHRKFIGFAHELAIVSVPLNWVKVCITQFDIHPILVPVFGQIDTLSLHALQQSKKKCKWQMVE